MPRETLLEVRSQRDEFRKRWNVAESVMWALARKETPDAEDSCTMPDGTVYVIRVFGVDRANGGTVLISFEAKGYGDRMTFDAQLWDDALLQARATATSSPESWAYREAFDRLEAKVRKIQAEGPK